MRYVLFCEDKPDSEALRLATREAHLAYVGTQSGLITLAGPMLSDDGQRMVGSLFIVEAETADAVRELNANDPYTRAGLWGNVVIRPFRQVVPAL
ncbi:MAG: YciI family protein [Pseudomonadales bacterium]